MLPVENSITIDSEGPSTPLRIRDHSTTKPFSMCELHRVALFNVAPTPPFCRPVTYEGDMELADSGPSKYTMAAELRKGISMRITEASSISDHIDQAAKGEFYLAKDTPIPGEVGEYIRIITGSNGKTIARYWESQLSGLRPLNRNCDDVRLIWNASSPQHILAATGNLRTATLAHMAESIGLGGGKWIRRPAYGSTLVGNPPQCAVHPRDASLFSAPLAAGIWGGAAQRFAARAKSAGNQNAHIPRGEASDKVLRGVAFHPSAHRYHR